MGIEANKRKAWRCYMKMTLGKKLGLAFSGLILLYGLFTGIWEFHVAKNYTSNEILLNNQQTVRNVKDYYLQNMLAEVSKTTVYWSVHPSLIGMHETQETRIESFVQLDTEWKSYMRLNPNISCIYFGAESTGLLRAVPENRPLPKHYDARSRVWYQGALKNPNKVYWSKPYKDAGSEEDMILTVSKAVIQGDRVIGVVGMDIKLKAFSRMLKGVYANEAGAIVVMDSKGEVYAHPEDALLATDLSKTQWAKDALNAEEGRGFFSEGGSQQAYAFVTLPETGWKLVGIRPVNLAALYQNLMGITLGTALMSAFVMLMGGVLSARLIMKPLRIMMETIHSVSRGELHARTGEIQGISASDELGEISHAFDQMLDRVSEINAELEASVEHIHESYLSTVRSLANAIEADDPYTRGHCQRVCGYALLLGSRMGLSDQEMKDLEFAGLLHDIGKIGIPDEIITKPGKLTEEEFVHIRRHPTIGAEILKDISFLEAARGILLQHHERVDGKGYPAKLGGTHIHRSAKILAITDSYDAMTSNRPYRNRPMSRKEALLEIEKGKGVQFDEELADMFIKLLGDSKAMEEENENHSLYKNDAV